MRLNGIFSLELSRQLGISQDSAGLMKHKLMQAMLECNGARQLAGVAQIDDACWGGWRRRANTAHTRRLVKLAEAHWLSETALAAPDP